MKSGRRVSHLAIIALAFAVPASAADAPVLTPEAAASLLRKSPDFAGRPARTLTDVQVIDVSDADPDRGWVVEARWQEKGTPVVGRAVVVAESVAAESANPPREKLFFSADGWVLPYRLVTGTAADRLLTDLQGARRASNEMMAKGDTRTLISAQYAFAMNNDGKYGSLVCLAAPRDCNPAYTGPVYVSAKLASAGDQNGYRRRFYLYPDAAGFVYTSVPLEPGVTGVKGFCTDHTGRLCFTPDGRVPEVKGGTCPASCTTTQ